MNARSAVAALLEGSHSSAAPGNVCTLQAYMVVACLAVRKPDLVVKVGEEDLDLVAYNCSGRSVVLDLVSVVCWHSRARLSALFLVGSEGKCHAL